MSQNILVKNPRSANRIQKAIENDAKRAAKYKPRKVEEHDNTTGQPPEQLTGQPPEQLTGQPPELTPNQKIINEYTKYVKKNPELLPETECFDIIYKIIKTIEKEDPTERDEDKKNSLQALYKLPTSITRKMKDLLDNSIDTTILTNKSNINIYDYLARGLYYNIRTTVEDTVTNKDKTTKTVKRDNLNISIIKHQLGADLNRLGNIQINTRIITPNEILQNSSKETKDNPETEITGQPTDYEKVDYFNTVLMETLDKESIPISLNLINLIDLCSIQQVIQFTVDMITEQLYNYSISQQGGNKSLKIVLTKKEQYIELSIESYLRNTSSEYLDKYPKAQSLADTPLWGTLNCVLKINLQNLSYSNKIKFTITEQSIIIFVFDKSRVAVENSFDYAKENPRTAASVGAPIVLGSAVGALFLAGVLGGKTNKHSYKKYKNRKSTRKNNKKNKKKNKKKNNNKNKRYTKKNKKL